MLSKVWVQEVLVWYRCGCGCQHHTSSVWARLFGAPCSGGLRRSLAMGLQQQVLGGCFSPGSFWEEEEAAVISGIGWDLVCQLVSVPGDPCCWGHVGRCWNCDYAMVNLVKHYKALLSSCFQRGPLQMAQHVSDTRCVVVPVGDLSRCALLHNLRFLDVLLHIQTVRTRSGHTRVVYAVVWESWSGGFSKWSSGVFWPCW